MSDPGRAPLATLRRITGTRARAAGRRALRDVRGRRSPTSTSTSSTCRAAALMCTCRPCYLLFTDRAGRAALPRGARTATSSFPGFRLGRPTGTTCRSRSGWRSCSATPRRTGWSRSTRARPAPPSPSCRWPPGTAIAGREPRRWPPLLPDVEALLVRGTDREHDGLSCHLVPIDACYELVGRMRHDLARLRRRPGGPRRARRVLREVDAAQPAGAEVARRERAGRFAVLDVAPTPYAAAPQLTARLRIEETHRRAGARDRAALPGAHRAAAPAATTTADEPGLRALFGDRDRWPQTLKPFQWMQCHTTVQGFTGSTEVDLALPCTYDFDVTGSPATCTRVGDGHGAAEPAVQRHRLHPRRARLRGAAGAVGRRGALRAAGAGLAGHDGGVLPAPAGWIRLDHDVLAALGDYRARHGLIVLGGDRRAGCSARRPARSGVRAVSAVRDRLERARAVADAVLYEGYLLYPYRASSDKNQRPLAVRRARAARRRGPRARRAGLDDHARRCCTGVGRRVRGRRAPAVPAAAAPRRSATRHGAAVASPAGRRRTGPC